MKTIIGIVFISAILIVIGVYTWESYNYIHPLDIVTKITFTLLDKDGNQILTTSGSTLDFYRQDEMSIVEFKHEWKSLEIGKSYMCDKLDRKIPFSSQYSHQIFNCKELP
jgi:hypothetical protein